MNRLITNTAARLTLTESLLVAPVTNNVVSSMTTSRYYTTDNNKGGKNVDGKQQQPKKQYINKSNASFVPPSTSQQQQTSSGQLNNGKEVEEEKVGEEGENGDKIFRFGGVELPMEEEEEPLTLAQTKEMAEDFREIFDYSVKPEDLDVYFSKFDQLYGYDPKDPENLKRVDEMNKNPTKPVEMITDILGSYGKHLDQEIAAANQRQKEEREEKLFYLGEDLVGEEEDEDDKQKLRGAGYIGRGKVRRERPEPEKGRSLDEMIEEEFINPTGRETLTEGYENQREYADNIDVKKKQEESHQLPYQSQSKEIETRLRMHLNKFLVKIHPDIFHSQEEKRIVNQKSLTQLNNLIRTRDQYIQVANGDSTETKLDKIPSSLVLSFHHLSGDTTAFVEHELTFEDPAENVSTSKSALVEYVTELRFAIHRQLYELMAKCDIPIPQEELEMLSRPNENIDQVFEDPWDDYFGLNNLKESKKGYSIANALEEFLQTANVGESRITAPNTLEHDNLLHIFDEDKVFFYYGESVKGDLNVMRQLGYRDEAERQIVHIKKYITAIEFKDWSNLPILVTTPEHYEAMKKLSEPRGFVVLLKDFVPHETLGYIKKVVPQITKSFNDLYSISKNNQTFLQDATVKLERLLGSSSVLIENLFSVNQRTMNQVREKFTTSNTLVSKMELPMLKVVEQARANRWATLPVTKIDSNVMDQWKLNNIKMDQKEISKLAQKIAVKKLEKKKDGQYDQQELKNAVDREVGRISELILVEGDRLENPLTIVDSHRFNYVQSAPFVNDAMTCIDKLTKLAVTGSKVPFVLPKQLFDSKTKEHSRKLEHEEEQEDQRLTFELMMGNEEMTVDKLADRPSLASIDRADFKTSADTVSSFNVPSFGEAATLTNKETTTNAKKSAKVSESSAMNEVSRVINFLQTGDENANTAGSSSSKVEKKIEDVIVNPTLKLTDFSWANINLIISDHYRFIMNKESDVAYVFIPSNFKEEELLLFLTANYDKMLTIQNQFYTPVLEKTRKVLQVQSIANVISSIRQKVPFASIKIDNVSLSAPELQYNAAQFFKNNIYLSTDRQSIEKIAPFVDVIIGANGKNSRIHFNQQKDRATLILSFVDRASMNVSKIINDLVEQSDHFKQLLPNFQYSPLNPLSQQQKSI